MRRRILTSLLFLPLLVVTLLWIRSYLVEDDLQCMRGRYDDMRELVELSEEEKAAPVIVCVDDRYFTLASYSIRIWHCPWWFLALVAMLPLWKIPVRIIRRRRSLAGLCNKCGYDLRAHKPGDRCPECGRPFDPVGPQKNTRQTAAAISEAAMRRRASSALE